MSNNLYKVCSNPNDSIDKSLCILVQDDSPFDGAVIRYTTFKITEQELTGDDIACQYKYEIEIPPHDVGMEISEEAGTEFEKNLGEWLIEIIQQQMDEYAAKDRNLNT
jgi:hypothetical protein